MSRTRIAVIGAGHLGRIHARLLASVDRADLVGVVDPDEVARNDVAAESQTLGFASHRDLIGDIDAAIIAAPTHLHHTLAMELLNERIHLLIEKPIALNAAEADELVTAAKRNNLVLQVGHVERFNPALEVVAPYIGQPKYIESTRTSGYTFRSTDIGVVLDLMIHDIDIVMSLADSRVSEVHALGLTVFGPHEDMAQARLAFNNGCVANLSASRTSFHCQRKMQIYGTGGYTAIDFGQQVSKTIRPCQSLLSGELDIEQLSDQEKNNLRENLFSEVLPLAEVPVQECNALLEEQRDFVDSIREERSPRVSGQQGRDVMIVADAILEKIAAHRWNGESPGPVGPRITPSLPALFDAEDQSGDNRRRMAG